MSATAPTRFTATGRRKTAVAKVVLTPGNGQVLVNKRALDDYFPSISLRRQLQEPFEAVEGVGNFDLVVTVGGGGINGQAGAARLGIARALERWNPEFRTALKRAGYLRRDSRIKERKKYGQRGARARFQFSKR